MSHKVFVFLLLVGFFSANSSSAQFGEFQFDKKVHKFDPAPEGETLISVFPFINKGDAPLIISHYEVECTCTVVEYPKEPILPGQSGEIRVTFDSKGKVGWQYRKVRLYANTKKNPTEVEFRVKILNP